MSHFVNMVYSSPVSRCAKVTWLFSPSTAKEKQAQRNIWLQDNRISCIRLSKKSICSQVCIQISNAEANLI